MDTFSITGAVSLLASSQNCRLFKSSVGSSYLLYQFTNNANNTITASNIDLSTLLSSNTATEWKVSDDCSKIVGNPLVYATVSGTMTQVMNTTSLSFDSSLTYGLFAG